MNRFVANMLFPGAAVAAAVLVFVWLGAGTEAGGSLAGALPHIALVAGLFCGWRFERNRLVVGVLAAVFAAQAARIAGAETAAGAQRALFLREAAAALLPLNFGVLALLPERGMATTSTIWRMTVLAVQIAGVCVVYAFAGAEAARILGAAEARLPAGAALSVPVLSAFFVGALTAFAAFLWRPSAMEAGFLWSVLIAFAGVALETARPAAEVVCFSASGLVLVFAAIESAHQQAVRDELTGLPARGAFERALNELSGAFTAAMIDIDHFKEFNDRYGHEVGDQVLRMVAGRFAEAGGGGRYFRYGGEEFVALFYGKTGAEAVEHMESLRKAVASRGFVIRGARRPRRRPKQPQPLDGQLRKVAVTVSIGVAHRDAEDIPASAVVAAADMALYKAKKAGRNRVVLAD